MQRRLDKKQIVLIANSRDELNKLVGEYVEDGYKRLGIVSVLFHRRESRTTFSQVMGCEIYD